METFSIRASLGNWKVLWSGSTVVSLKRSLSINQFIYHLKCPLYTSTDWFYGSIFCIIVEKLIGLKEIHKNFKQNHYWRFSEYVTYVSSCHFCHHESQNHMFFGGNYSDRWPKKHWEQLLSSMLETFTVGQTGVRESFLLTWHFFSSSVTFGLNITQSVTVCLSTSWSTGWLISSGLAFSANHQV